MEHENRVGGETIRHIRSRVAAQALARSLNASAISADNREDASTDIMVFS